MAQAIEAIGWHPGANGIKRLVEKKLFYATRGFRLKDAAESLVSNPVTRPFVAPRISEYVLAPFKRKGLIFVHIPKNAGTSVGRALYGKDGLRLAHYTARFYRALAPKFYDYTPSMAILRDPIDRFISAYFFVKNSGGALIDLYPEWVEFYKRRCIEDLTFDQFIDLQRELSWNCRRMDYVFRPQHEFVTDRNGCLMVTNLFVMGRHDAELRRYCELYDATAVPHLNRTAKRDLDLTKIQAKAIMNLYPEDIELVYRLR